MGLVTGKWLTPKVVSFVETGKGIGRRLGGPFLAQNSLQPFNDEIFDGGPAEHGGDFRPACMVVGQIYRRLFK